MTPKIEIGNYPWAGNAQWRYSKSNHKNTCRCVLFPEDADICVFVLFLSEIEDELS